MEFTRLYSCEDEENIFDIMQIFTLLLHNKDRNNLAIHGIAPSIHMQQMLMTTEERTVCLMRQERNNKPNASGAPSVFLRATPSTVIFQQFCPGNTYIVTMSVTNITSFPQELKLICTKNSWFRFEYKDAAHNRKLAPGMSIMCDVKFSPEERRDYKHRAVFVVGSGTFEIPVIAIGPRPLLDFPDFIEVPQTAVKILSVKQLLVRNIGDVPARFSLSTNSPFTVYPQKGVLAERETMKMTVNFLPKKRGCFKESLVVTYETGEIIGLNLCGYAQHAVIRLDRRSIRMEETFLGLTRSKTFSIHNRSDYVSTFQWVLHESSSRDRTEKEKYKKSFELMKTIEAVHAVDLEHYNICNNPLHELACQRIFTDELSCLTKQPLSYCHPNYRLVPLEGEIWPHSTVDVTLIFEPDEIGIVTSTAYLEVTGCAERIPLSIRGTCIGPSLKLNVTTADLGFIFLCSSHNYEVICQNTGDIPATLVYNPKPANFGGKISVDLVEVKLQSGNYKSVNLSFSSNRTGEFTEKVEFIVKESLEKISMLLKGCVICPKLYFDKPNLDFSVTALGFTAKHEICLHNSSLVPVTFGLTITQDGTNPALTHGDFARCVMKPSLASSPKEFGIIPSEGVVAPHSFQRIKLSYTPNVVRTSQTSLRADMWDSNSEPVTLPITFSSKVASLVVKPSEIVIRFCFINFPYVRFITVENKSDVEGYFYLAPQLVSTTPTVMYSLSSYQGCLKPNESKSISLKIVTTALGAQRVQLSLLTLGERSLSPCCSLICYGQGPIVTVEPTQLNWGDVRLLQQVESKIILFSDSPIPAQFVAELHNAMSPWTVSPSSGSLKPNQSLELKITIYLRDTGKYTDRVDIRITNGRVITCSLTAIGIGTSIHLCPDMLPVFDMGFLFRDQNISIPIRMTNKGTRPQRLTWTTNTDHPAHPSIGTTEREPNKFTIDPYSTDLSPGAESVVHCKIRWKLNEILTEQWFFYGQVKGQGKREILGTSIFKATFKDPNISFSKRKLTFQYDPSASELNIDNLTDSLFLTNHSQLDLTVRVIIEPPFELVRENEDDTLLFDDVRTMVLLNDVSNRICVRLNTQAIGMSNLYSRTFRGALTFDYKTLRAKDKIECIAEVNYPNIFLLPAQPVVLGCEIGLTTFNCLTLVNVGHLPVRYNFEWLDVKAVGKSTTHQDMPCIRDERSRARDCVTSSEKQEDHEEDASVGADVGDTEEEEGEIKQGKEDDCEEERKDEKEEIRSMADLFTNYDDNAYPRVSLRQVSIPADKGLDLAVMSISGCTSVLIAGEKDNESNSLPSFVQVDANEIRDFIFPMTRQYHHADAEILALIDWLDTMTTMPTVPQCCDIDATMEILDMAPKKGSLLPHSSQYVYVQLDASPHRCIDIDTGVACHVESGPTSMLSLRASADTIRYSVDKKTIDFGHQLIGVLCRETLAIANRGTVGFTFRTKVLTEGISGRVQPIERTLEVDRLIVEPEYGTVDPMTKMYLHITYYTGLPGPFYGLFDLEIAHHAPLTIEIAGYGTMPQVYLTAPRHEAFYRLPFEICYRAVGTLSARFSIEAEKFDLRCRGSTTTVEKDAPEHNRLAESERQRLTASGWEMVFGDADTLPSVTDIEMAVERLLATEGFRRNTYSTTTTRGVSSLLVPEYIIDMGYVVVEQVGYYSAILVNYGPTPVDVRVNKAGNKSTPPKNSGISVKFRNRKSLRVGESTSLNVLFHPSRSVYTEKRTDIEHKIYLEVTHGATVPISVRAVATYPFVTANTAYLSFEDVSVGNCMLMPIRLRNDGWVDCEWEATIRCADSCRSKKEGGPFFLHYNSDTFPPGHESVINIYFEPKEARFSAAQLRIRVQRSIYSVLVSISGRGVEPQLHVSEDTLRFETVLPYVRPEPKTFFLTNTGSCPVEVFWHGFDRIFVEEERVIRILMHYYGVDEIWFPCRSPGDKLSSRIYDFYRTLTEEMVAALAICKASSEHRGSKIPIESQDVSWRENGDQRKEQLIREDVDEDKNEDEPVGTVYNVGGGGSPYRSSEIIESSSSVSRQKSNGERVKTTSYFHGQMVEKFSELSVEDPNQMEALLHCYVDELRGMEDFSETMKDPLKEVFEDSEVKLPSIDHPLPKSRPCIIFHGAPFTDYQQAACEVGKKIGVSVLNINNAIIEIIALGHSACSDELRRIVNKSYYELHSRWETQNENRNKADSETKNEDANQPAAAGESVQDWQEPCRKVYGVVGASDTDNVSSIGPKSFKITENDGIRMAIHQRLPTQSGDIEEFNKIFRIDELDPMDPLDVYEYKIRSILLLQKIMQPSEPKEDKLTRKPRGDLANVKVRPKTASSEETEKLDSESTILGIRSDLIREALEERLAMPDFRAGFTVQTIDNIFIKTERDTLITLLNVIDNAKDLLFVTFYNTLNMYLTHNDKLIMAEEMKATVELEKKLDAIEEMTLTEYENISDEDKMLYASKMHDCKIADSLRRRSAYNRKLAGTIWNKNTRPLTKLASAAVLYGTQQNHGKTAGTDRMTHLAATSNESDLTKPKRFRRMNSEKIGEGITDENATQKDHQPLPGGLAEVSRLMDIYQTSLAHLQPLLANWDPSEFNYVDAPGNNKPPTITRAGHMAQQTADSKGINVLYVAPVDPWNSDIYVAVVHYLAENTRLKIIPPSQDQRKMNLNSKLYTVVRQKSTATTLNYGGDCKPSGVYTLTSVREVTEAGSDFSCATELTMMFSVDDVAKHVEQAGSSSNIEGARLSRDSHSNSQGTIRDLEHGLRVKLVEEAPKSRWIMQPDERCIFKVHFTPKSVGVRKDTYRLNIVGSNITRCIEIEGCADVPKLSMEPEVIFGMVKQSKLDDLDTPSYFLDTRTYDFGSLPITQSEENRVQHTREAKFTLLNPSTTVVHVAIYRIDNSDAYSIAPDSMRIAPGESNAINVSARVFAVGLNSERLLLCIKDNPHVEIIQLQSYGSKLEVELEGKDVSFGKVLLWHTARQIIVLKNKSSISLYWRLNLKEKDAMNGQLIMNPERGFVQPLATCNIECSFSAKLVGKVETEIITFQVYLQEHDVEPLLTDFITITGETYDVKVDLTNASPIDFKMVRVGTLATETFGIENRGQHDVGFIVQSETLVGLQRLNVNCSPTLIGDLNTKPTSGTLSTGKHVIVSVDLLPRDELTIVEAPLLKCLLIDTTQMPTVVAVFPILVSVTAQYARFTIEPSLGLNFGSVAVSDRKTMHLNIKNTGYFSLQYKISGPAVTHPLSSDSPTPSAKYTKYTTENTDKTSTFAARSTDTATSAKKHDKTPLTTKAARHRADAEIPGLSVGPFSLSRNQGVVEAGEVETIAVHCYPDSVTIFAEELSIFVPSTGTIAENGLPVKLSANGCMPTIDFHDLDAIFQENLIVYSIEDFVCSRELGSHSIYSRKEKCLYFRRVGLSSTHTTRLRFYNSGLVYSDVSVKLKHEKPDSGEGDRNADAFAVEPRKARVPPLSAGIFIVSFSPTLLGSYSAVFDIILELPQPLNSPWISIKLCGEGAVPEVAVLEPTSPQTNQQILMNFGQRHVNDAGYRVLSLKNVGSVKAKVIVEVNEAASGFFTLEAIDQLGGAVIPPRGKDYVQTEHRTVCRLMPEDIVSVVVKFAPLKVGKYESRINIHTMDNPYEDVALVILGEGYAEDVIVEGLELAESIYTRSLTAKRPSKSRKGSGDSELETPTIGPAESITSIVAYKLDYGSCFLNEVKEIPFKITNKSKENLFRFEWAPHPNVVFSPSIGHLTVLKSRTIVATFSALTPIVHSETQLECTISRITMLNGELSVGSWDDEQRHTRWRTIESGYSLEPGEGEIESREPLFVKVVESIPESSRHSVVPGSTRVIRVLLAATAAYSRYDCPVKQINLKDTLIFQTCRYTFILSNPGVVNMSYEWNLHMGARCPVRLSNSTLSEVFESFNDSHGPGCYPKSRTLSGTLYPSDPTNYDHLESSAVKLSAAGNARRHTGAKRRPSKKTSNFLGDTAGTNESGIFNMVDVNNYYPFEIEPAEGVLAPAESIECTLIFSPLEVSTYQAYLACRVENQDPALPPLNIEVTARSLLPYYHFDIPESHYLSNDNQNASVLGLLETEGITSPTEHIRVIDFQVIGVGQMHVKKFRMTNPTTEDYEFSWKEIKIPCMEEMSCFDCILAEGVAERGKQTEFTFTFFAKDVGNFKSFWSFSIGRYELETMFLFVATVTEPLVYIIPGNLNMKPTVTGAISRDSITVFNGENIALPFCIIPKSLYSADRIQRLTVDPMSGILQPNSEEHLKIQYQPVSPGESKFFIRCRIDKRKKPLVAIVTGNACVVEPSVVCRKESGEVQRIDCDKNNVINCGNLQVEKPFILNILLKNGSPSVLHYTWDLYRANRHYNADNSNDNNCEDDRFISGVFSVRVQEQQGRVSGQSTATCFWTITAHQRASELNQRIALRIHRGPTYEICLKGTVRDPSHVLNFNEYNFGPSYIQLGNVCHYSVKIHFTNNEETPCTLECKFDDLPHLFVYSDHIAGAVPGLSSVSILVKFMPLERICYRETITLLINSTITESISIRGEGIEFKVCLLDPQHKFLDIGDVLVGKSVTRNIPLINKGRAPVVLKLGLANELTAFDENCEKDEACTTLSLPRGFSKQEDIPSNRRAPPRRADLSIEPFEPTTLYPNKKLDISVTYSPVKRTAPFEVIVACQIHETILPLLILRSACLGAEFLLDRTFLSFGTVVEGCSHKMQIVLSNTGDIGGRFNWNVGKLVPHYTLVPQAGYCSPGMDVRFDVTFSPMHRSDSIAGQAIVEIENFDSMTLTTSGTCVARESYPEPTDTIHMSTRVRQPTSVNITVSNPSCHETWTLESLASGIYFTATERFTVPPLGFNVCTVVYRPLLMTADGHVHRGTVYLKLPEGRGLLYAITGISLPPDPFGKILRDFPARTKYTELLPVSNWLERTQRFACNIELLNDKGGRAYSFMGNKTIDIPSKEERDYRAVFYSYTEGNFSFQVTFTNDEGEYHRYELDYKVTKPGIADTIKLTTTVRTVVCHLLKLENPLCSRPLTYTIESPHPYVTVSENPKLVDPQSTLKVKMEFNPMVPLETTVTLEAKCAELGTFVYALCLKATPAAPEKPFRISAMLGNSASFPLTIRNHAKWTVNFSITIDSPSFVCGMKNVSINGLEEVAVCVTYEPCELRNVHATLRATSPNDGEYMYVKPIPVIGTCGPAPSVCCCQNIRYSPKIPVTYHRFPVIGTTIPPKPQGPYAVSRQRPAIISFKNIFDATKTFHYHVDRPESFHLSRSSDVVESKKAAHLTVGLVTSDSSENQRNCGAPVVGKLSVSVTEAVPRDIKWIYYLRGTLE